MTKAQIDSRSETVLDISEIPWLPKSELNSTKIESLEFNCDHSSLAFTLNNTLDNTLTSGVYNIETKEFSDFKVSNISQCVIFGDIDKD